MPLRSEIRNVEHEIARELTLEAQAPLVDVRGEEVRVDARRDDRGVAGKRIRQVRERPRRGGERPRGLPHAEGGVARKRGDPVADDLQVVERAEAGADHGRRAAERPPRQAHARRPVVLVGRPQPAPHVGPGSQLEECRGRVDERLLAAGDLDRVRGRVERGYLVHPFHRREVQLVANPEIQRQSRRQLPVVLEVITGAEGHRVVEGLAQVPVGLARQPEQQVGDGVARILAVERKGSAAERSEERVEQEAPDVGAPAHRMRPLDNRHVLDVMICIVVAPLREIRRPADGGDPGDGELRRSVVERGPAGVGQAADAEAVDDVGVAVLLQTIEAEARVADARFVDQPRPPDPSPDESGVHRALQLVASPTWNVAGGAERVRDREELGAVGVLIGREHRVLRSQLLVDPDRELVEVVAPGAGGDEVLRARRVRRRIEREQPGPLLAPERLGDLVVRKRTVVVEGVAQRARGAEIAVAHGQGGHRRRPGFLLAAPLPLVADEEKRLVAPDRPACHAAKLVAPEARLGWREIVLGVEGGVAMELVCGAVQVVRPRPGRDDDLAPGLSSVLGRVGPGQHLELAHGVQDRPVQRLVGGLVVVVDPVLDVVVGDLAVAGHVEAAAEPEGGVLRGSEDVGLKLGELQVVAAVERQLDDLLLVDHVAERHVLGLDQGRFGRDLDGLADAADLEADVDAGLLSGLEHDSPPDLFLEAGELDREHVLAGHELRDDVVARDVGLGRAGFIGAGVGGRDLCAGNRPAGFVGHTPEERGADPLRVGGRRAPKQRQRHERSSTFHGHLPWRSCRFPVRPWNRTIASRLRSVKRARASPRERQ